jgi:hypothetical protein
VSRTRTLGLAAYRRLISAVPAAAVDVLDTPLTAAKARRADAADARAAARWADRVSVPSKWYAVDGSNAFYFFRRKKLDWIIGDHAFGRIAVTACGTTAADAFHRHGGQLVNRKPAGWLSAATIAAVNYGGLDGGPRDWGWTDNEDSDLDIAQVERLRAADPGPYITGQLSDYAERVSAALARA